MAATQAGLRITVAARGEAPIFAAIPAAMRTDYRGKCGRRARFRTAWDSSELRASFMARTHALSPRAAVLPCLCSRAPVACVEAQDAPIVLAPHRAVYDLSLGRDARQLADRGGPRAHPLRFRRQCLRGLFAGISPGLRTRYRRGQSIHQRSALDHLGRRRRQELQIHVAEFSRSESGRYRRRPCRAWRHADGHRSRQARAQDARSRCRRWCFRPNTWCG